MKSLERVGLSAFLSLVAFLTSETAIAQILNGNFSTTTSSESLVCDGSPSSLSPGTLSVTATSNNVSVTYSSSDYTYSGSGTVSLASSTSTTETFSGSLSVGGFSIVGGSSLDSIAIAGTELIASVIFDAVLDIASNTITSASLAFSGDSSGCLLQLDITSSAAIAAPPGGSPLSGGSGNLIDPTITASSIVTAPIIFRTQMEAISGNLSTRISDLLRSMTGQALRSDRRDSSIQRSPGSTTGLSRSTSNFEKESSIGGVPLTENSQLPSGNDDEVEALDLPIKKINNGVMVDFVSGVNAGDGTVLPIGAWGSYSYSDFESDFAPMAFDGNLHTGMAGVDIRMWEKAIFGLSMAFENNDIDTDFNQGNQETDGYTIAPYFGFVLSDNFTFDGHFGYSNLDTDQFRTLPGTTTRVTSSTDADRWFGAANLTGLTTIDRWFLSATLGILYATDNQDRFIESDGTLVTDFESKLGQTSFAGEAAYMYDEFEPFVRVAYEHYFEETELGVLGSAVQPSFDDDDVLLGGGLRYFGTQGLTGNVEFKSRLGRENYDDFSFTATLRYEW